MIPDLSQVPPIAWLVAQKIGLVLVLFSTILALFTVPALLWAVG